MLVTSYRYNKIWEDVECHSKQKYICPRIYSCIFTEAYICTKREMGTERDFASGDGQREDVFIELYT